MPTRTFRLGPVQRHRQIFGSQIDNRTTADRVLPRIGGMKSEFDTAHIEPSEPILERHKVNRATRRSAHQNATALGTSAKIITERTIDNISRRYVETSD